MNQIQRAESALISPDLKTTSLIVAEKFGKTHKHVLEAIRNLEIPDSFRKPNFRLRDIIQQHSTGASKTKAYELTRDGFSLLVMGFTGKKAMAWKIKFLEAFNAMEAELANPAAPKALPKPETLTEAQKSTIQAMILARFPNKNRREWAYMALKAHFKVSRYAFIPKTEYIEALSFISNITEERIHDLIMSALFDSDEIRAYRIDHKMREGVERRLQDAPVWQQIINDACTLNDVMHWQITLLLGYGGLPQDYERIFNQVEVLARTFIDKMRDSRAVWHGTEQRSVA